MIKRLLFFSLTVVFFWGCHQKGLSSYQSPQDTYRTYARQSETLRVVADHRHFRRIIRCFTKADRKWFNKNFDSIKFDREEYVYENLYKTKKKAYVFGRAVVGLGPSPDEKEYTFTEINPDEAELTVKGYAKKIKFIKEGDEWKIVGLFGAREKVSD